MILWRQLLPDKTMPSTPQDHGLPVCTVYGAYAILKMRGFQSLGMGVKEIVPSFYGEGMEIEPTQSRNWSYNAMMRRGDEEPARSEEVAVRLLEQRPLAAGFNEALRESSMRQMELMISMRGFPDAGISRAHINEFDAQ
jgi:hypothetical protein